MVTINDILIGLGILVATGAVYFLWAWAVASACKVPLEYVLKFWKH